MAGGVAGQQRTDRVAGPGLAQRHQQLGDGPRVVEAGLGCSPSGGTHGVAEVDLAQEADEPTGGVSAAQGYRRCP